ncbi:MAG: hypothetical protein QOG91_666 [Candidatus Parcubacteria bacterium]|jgi:hypothetical protein|nr:hypothetical protein [Candidatus Parcubacteria bacterium]
MKKRISLIVIGVAIVMAIVYISRPSSRASGKITQASQASNGPALRTSDSPTNLHFDGLQIDPKVQ